MRSNFVEEHNGFLMFILEEIDHAKAKFPDIKPAAQSLLEYCAEREAASFSYIILNVRWCTNMNDLSHIWPIYPHTKGTSS